MFAGDIRKKRVQAMRQHTHWRWHLDEVYVRINGEMRYLWRAVDHEGEVLILQKFSAIHASLHNHFSQERHLVSRAIYKQRRSAALAEWRSVLAQSQGRLRQGGDELPSD